MTTRTNIVAGALAATALLFGALRISADPAATGGQCLSSLEESHKYVSSVDFDYIDLNNIEFRNAVIQRLAAYKQRLDSCDVVLGSADRARRMEIADAFADFRDYQSTINSLILLIDVKDLEMSPGYVGIVERTASKIIGFPIKQFKDQRFRHSGRKESQF